MSVPPNMMAQMLMQQGGVGAAPTAGGAPAGAMQGGSDMIRKIMMIKALQGQQAGQLPQAQPNVMGQVAAQPQAMQQMQMPGGVNA